MTEFDPRSDYPLATNRPDLVRTPSGLPLDELTIDQLFRGSIPDGDFRATPQTLRMQADVARSTDLPQLADNLDRAAELAIIPDEVILEIYTALRPGRSSAAELADWADLIETTYQAPSIARLVREAAAAYEARGILR